MKIVVIGPTYPYRGGISHYNTLLCENLSKKHVGIDLITKIKFLTIHFGNIAAFLLEKNKVDSSIRDHSYELSITYQTKN